MKPVLRLALTAEEKELHNKCDECCSVIGCDVCGPCVEHDAPVPTIVLRLDGGIPSVVGADIKVHVVILDTDVDDIGPDVGMFENRPVYIYDDEVEEPQDMTWARELESGGEENPAVAAWMEG